MNRGAKTVTLAKSHRRTYIYCVGQWMIPTMFCYEQAQDNECIQFFVVFLEIERINVENNFENMLKETRQEKIDRKGERRL